MRIEYRSITGRRLKVEGNGQVLEDRSPANLRAMGCPEHLVRSLERKREQRREMLDLSSQLSRAAEIAKQIEADNAKFAHVLAAPAEPASTYSVVDAEMQKRLKQASGRTSR
jgi:hypothetical protein